MPPPKSKSYDREGKVRDVRAFMREHPGVAYRPTEVAQALGLTTHQAAEALLYLAEQGQILRKRKPNQRSGPGSTTYTGLAVIDMPDDPEEATA